MAGVTETQLVSATASRSMDIWDHLIDESTPGYADEMPINETDYQTPSASVGPIPIEDHIIPLPSNGNVGDAHRALELSYRISLAERHLNHLRDLIAEKSFQYSHVIRVAPRKAIATRSRSVIKKLNHEIADHCRMYTHCRSTFLSLNAGKTTLAWLKDLKFDDVGASTAVLSPNEPGSTRIKLSWIWQTSARYIPPLADSSHSGIIGPNAEQSSNADPTLDAVPDPDPPSIMVKCESLIIIYYILLTFIQFYVSTGFVLVLNL